MNSIQKRFLIFMVGCMGVRALITIIAKSISVKYLPILGYMALIPAVGFMYSYLNGLPKSGKGAFGGKIWWNDLRPVHAFLYYMFAHNAILKRKHAWRFLALDVLLGLYAFLQHYYSSGYFSKLLSY